MNEQTMSSPGMEHMIKEQQDKLRRTKKRDKFMKGFEQGRVCSDYLSQYGNEQEFESNLEALTNFTEFMRSGIPDELKVMLKLLCNGLQSPTKVSSSLPPAPPPACPSPPASTAFPALAPWLRYLSAEHQDLILQLYLIFKIPGNGICLPGSLAAFCCRNAEAGQ